MIKAIIKVFNNMFYPDVNLPIVLFLQLREKEDDFDKQTQVVKTLRKAIENVSILITIVNVNASFNQGIFFLTKIYHHDVLLVPNFLTVVWPMSKIEIRKNRISVLLSRSSCFKRNYVSCKSDCTISLFLLFKTKEYPEL